jgi:hypothetical protein
MTTGPIGGAARVSAIAPQFLGFSEPVAASEPGRFMAS